MDQAYDRKFEEMKKYIPFLESMIKRLENNSSTSNPRQAQLDKIRSLRDLLLDKKKRMKMENLLKCEQVLVNLYSKVEQKEALPGLKTASDPTFPSKTKDSGEDLEVVRNKLKSVTTKIQEEQETLPEIARASATEELCTPGSKEPALFQRRPNKAPISPNSSKSPNKVSTSKRNYTRVLVSPEPGSRRWVKDDENTSSPLFSRRSPRRSPKRHSPTYHKKEKKKSSKQSQLRKAKDLNITLNVPEESLDSLNTKDILTRIMNCSDGDVDIETLREAKRQILDELKNTGAKCDDISDLLLKSYKKKEDSKKKDEVEEGELSDSESEAIQSIYGNFILEGDKDATSKAKDADSNEKPRKIQICLVINPDNENLPIDVKDTPIKPHDTVMTDFEMYDENPSTSTKDTEQAIETDNKNAQLPTITEQENSVNKEVVILDDVSEKVEEVSTEIGKPANFYTPLKDQGSSKEYSHLMENNNTEGTIVDSCASSKPDSEIKSSSSSSSDERPEADTCLKSSEMDKEDVEIPLLNEPSIATQKPKEDVVSEIDILQALKNEILSESLSIPGSETTPLLHQPKITKVSSVQEIVPKKRISIEKYKKKTEDSAKTSKFLQDLSRSIKEDNLKKQSLKLTEKECERFNFPVKLAFEDESEDDETDNDVSLDDLYGNLVPKSPDHNESQRKKIPPVIIPVEPVKTTAVSSKADVDMRMLISMLSPNVNTPVSSTDDLKQDVVNTDKTRTCLDPRVRRDLNQPANIDSSNVNSERLPRPLPPPINFPNLNPMTPSMNPSMTPNRTPSMTINLSSGIPQNITPSMNPAMTPTMAPHMTPSRNPNMTPNARTYEMVNRQNYEIDDSNSSRKHVYAPIFPLYDQRESREQSVAREKEHRSYWDKSDNDVDKRNNSKWDNTDTSERDPRSSSKEYTQSSYKNYDKHSRYKIDRRDSFNRSECPQIPFSRSDCPNTPSHPFGRVDVPSPRINPFSWSDCPTTPSHQFGRLDCPQTPSHPFGRSDCPQTPSHPFGRSDCPTTPIHPFGRSECPTTPIHTFGRSDCSTTPLHPFGRSDMPMTPSHPFGRSEHQSRDPRLNRSSDYESVHNDDRDRHYYRERGMSNYNQYNKSDTHRKYREHSDGRNERSNYSTHEHSNHNHTSRRESNVRNSMPRENLGSDNYNDSGVRHRNNVYRERSVGRSAESNDRMQLSSSGTPGLSQSKEDSENRLSVKPHTGKSFTIDTSINSTFQDFIEKSKDMRTINTFDRRKRAASVGRVLCRETNEGKSSHCEFSERRSFRRESSVGRSLHYESKHKSGGTDHNNRNDFRRARSMGRDIMTTNDEMSLKDIKVDFENYKANYDLRKSKELERISKGRISKERILKTENIKKDKNTTFKEVKQQAKPRNREDIYESNSKRMNSSFKKHIEHKTHKEFDNFNNRNKEYASRERNSKNVGIVYSNDNITKGKILGSGYGVKNYKIPKIKRPVEEENTVLDNKKDEVKYDREKSDEPHTKKKTLKSKNKCSVKVESDKNVTKLSKPKNIDKINKSENNVEKIDVSEKRVTRLSKKSDTEVENDGKLTITKPRKIKKSLVYNSDSDTELNRIKEKKIESSTSKKHVAYSSDSDSELNQVKEKKKESSTSSKNKQSPNEIIANTEIEQQKTSKTKEIVESSSDRTALEKEFKEVMVSTNNEAPNALKPAMAKSSIPETASEIKDQLDNSFVMDDMDIFSDNIASDSVIDNINALIANLDSDLEPSKITTPTEFSNDINFDKMLENIESDDEDETLSENLTDISEVIKDDLKQSINVNKETESTNTNNIKSPLKAKANDIITENRESVITSDIRTNDDNTCSSDNLVTTTGVEKALEETEVKTAEQNLDSSAAPDSTNEIIHNKSGHEAGLPDSTNETQNDTNSMVTSSHDSTETASKNNESSLSTNNEHTSMKSIGNILSLLQNKSKLKEILNMLGDQSTENDKIKKKLEKLSEIVSDEDDEKSLSTDNNQRDSTKDKEENSPHCSKDSINTSVEQNYIKNGSSDNIQQEMINKSMNENETEIMVSNDKNDQINESDKLENTKKVPIKKGKVTKRGKGRFGRKAAPKGLKRITRSEAKEIKPKKPSRELLQLQEDIKDMFISDDVLNATGIRMCRLAKLVDDKTSKPKDDNFNQDSSEPVVVLQKFKDSEAIDEIRTAEKNVNTKKKPGPKGKSKIVEIDDVQHTTNKLKTLKYKPGPKSKTKPVNKSDDEDPYAFESDSISEFNYNTKSVENKEIESSDSENESIGSSKSCGSSDMPLQIKKKPKRKRSGWQSGIIKPKNRKKKTEVKQTEIRVNDDIVLPQNTVNIHDSKCFTDKSYCFHINVFTYACRFCAYNGEDIVNHYKQNHPHAEIPLSRPSPEMAKEAIEQCEEINFQAISKMPSDTYVCRFCFKVFGKKKKSALEAFFWHVVSMHTGEYKHPCTLCESGPKCPFNLDIPPPPKDVKGQLIGYICEKCNFTQISLENLKTHVIVRHNDEKTEVYIINLGVMSRKAINALSKRCNAESDKPRVLRSSRLSTSTTEASDDHSDVADSSDHSNEQVPIRNSPKQITSPSLEKELKIKYQSKITFETDDNTSETSSTAESLTIKTEKEDEQAENNKQIVETKIDKAITLHTSIEDSISELKRSIENEVPSDIFIYPHFKIKNTESGSKEYLCCINGHDNHYKTTLLISFKKHVQLKHSEIWDGYCFTCKVIVTSQGRHKFQDCLQHYLDKHIDNFPVSEIAPVINEELSKPPEPEHPPTSKPYINVRPLSELLSNEASIEELPTMPKIENVMSLGTSMVEPPQTSPSYPPVISEPVQQLMEYKYEEQQANVMSKKHCVVLDTMLNQNKLVNVYKCAGRFCSFSSDSAEDALLHASTHQRVGGESSLICAYCDFECSGNAIDLVMHVFKAHSVCPYSCGYCFYRAASSQVVAAHINRLHNHKPVCVLSGFNITPPPLKGSTMLSREAVVQYYVCPHACKFRTYTAGKYCEHLLQRHSTETCHPCYLCSSTFETPVQLIQHMKCHDLNVYQCTWCTHGASTEGNLLYHTSQKHPDQQPQAYLRVITNKDGSSEYRVLPLASFNKTKVSVVKCGGAEKENPVREAERSIELEKLIGHTNQLIESMSPPPVNEPTVDSESIAAGITITDLDEEPDDVPAAAASPPPATPPPVMPVTPPSATVDTSQQLTPVIKQETSDTTPAKHTVGGVVCLDSDDDEPTHGTPAAPRPPEPAPAPAPDDHAPPAPALSPPPPRLVVASTKLLRCPSCKNYYRMAYTFRKHVISCCPPGELRCVHCGEAAADVDKLLEHCLEQHSADKHGAEMKKAVQYVCSECGLKFDTLPVAKRHARYSHRAPKVSAAVEVADDGQRLVRISPAPAPAPAARRKRSADEPPKMARYGPHDAHRLPIAPILEDAVFCAVCEFKTKVRLNMVRHLQLHAERQPAPSTAPVNPVPHLETNEMHFDRMLNLASSSIGTRPERAAAAAAAGAGAGAGAAGAGAGALGAEAAARYPRLVAARQRLACGARGCSYISLDEAMLRRHWDALHAGSNDFRCVHCPPYQHLDTSKPLTAARIVAHLKMHDVALYACSACQFYHYRRPVVDKHAAEAHEPAAAARSLVVREETAPAPASASAAAPTPAPAPAPTMDLKPWHCGLCSFLSMLRPEVVEHCARSHQSKMQFKCMYCPFRTSACENVTKHQANAHPLKKAEVFYYYYREGSVPDEPDGTPRWKRQRERFGCSDPPTPEVKSETGEPEAVPGAPSGLLRLLTAPAAAPRAPQPPPLLDLNIVKQEAVEAPLDLPQLLATYGQLCEPNGLKYKCPLCKVVIEDTKEAMQSHLYEELKYRKWACAICSYKAFHKTGLNEHIVSEHRGQNQQPKLLPVDPNIEKWVSSVLEHQANAINKNKENFASQKILTEKPSTSTANERSLLKPTPEKPSDKFTMTELEQAFGQLGVPNNMFFCCPKCNHKVKEEASMRDHLESELSKIRWCCSNCSDKFQTYHEAQFHCKSHHAGLAARPVEAPRDSALRAAWVAAVLQVQRLSMRCLPLTDLSETPEKATPVLQDLPENSLLVVRHEETISTSEESICRKRPAPTPDSDDERLVIDEPPAKKKSGQCSFCDFSTKYPSCLKEHIYRHYNVNPFKCPYCEFTGSYRAKVQQHMETEHEFESKTEPIRFVPMPTGPPVVVNLMKKGKKVADEESVMCLMCEKYMSDTEAETHTHDIVKAEFASRGDIVVKCCICLALRKDVGSVQKHHATAHAGTPLNYAFFKFLQNSRDIHCCGYCEKPFTYLKDMRTHHEAVHVSLPLKYQTVPYSSTTTMVIDSDDESESKRSSIDSITPVTKRVARKSTSKLPSQSVAKKSTSKLPFNDESESGYSFYGTKPSSIDEYENVTTLIEFYNTMVPFTLRKLNEILKINPVVLVEDIEMK